MDHIHLNTVRADIVNERGDELFRIVVQVQRSMDKIDAEDAESFLFLEIFLVPKPDVNGDLRGRLARFGLETNSEPSMGIVVPRVAARDDRVRKNEEPGV